jgi:cytochrome c5
VGFDDQQRKGVSLLKACICVVAGLAAGFALTGCSDGELSQAHPGEGIYNRSCFSCHAGGVAGAPIPGDAEAWSPRLAKGRDLLMRSVKDGMPPGMPPMGMCMTCSDEELSSAIDYMLAQ